MNICGIQFDKYILIKQLYDIGQQPSVEKNITLSQFSSQAKHESNLIKISPKELDFRHANEENNVYYMNV